MATATPNLSWAEYQALPPEKRRRPLTAAEYAALTPAQLEAAGLAEPSEGAPADFNGPVLPNPDHVAPAWDTDLPPVTRLPQGAQLTNVSDQQPMKLPPGAVLEQPAANDSQSMKLPPGATLEQPAAAKTEEPDQFAQDKAVTDAWAEQHPVLGPLARFLVSGGQNAANAITKTPSQMLHAIVDPSTPEEAGLTPEQRFVYRMGGREAIKAEEDYAGGKVSPRAAASVLPEALGTGVGQTAGGAVYGKANELAGEALPKIASAPKEVVTAPVRALSRTAETALNQKLVPLRKIANLMTPADEAEALNVKVPGRDFGLEKPAPKPAAELDATGENKDFAGEPARKTPKPARELDATGENREFAGGMDEFTPKPAPKAAGSPPAAAPQESTAAGSNATIEPKSTPTPKRSIVTDPTTGKPEFSDVISKRQEILEKLGNIADKIREQEKAEAASSSEPQAQPRTKAARVPEANEDLTQLMRESLEQIEAQKGGVYTSAAPADLAKRWGVDESSIADTDANVRGMSEQQSKAYIDKLAESYKKGRPVEPVMETRDAGNNITSVDGRHRALAAQKAGIERIPVIVRRMPAPAVQQ